MATINYTAAEIESGIAKANTAVQPAALAAVAGQVNDLAGNAAADIGELSSLFTTNKSSLVSAVNELFTSASDGKTAIAATITGEGVATSPGDSYATMAANIAEIRADWLEPKVVNGASITPTGTYATATYYDTTYGVKIGYMTNGDILLSMQGGTTTSYEYLRFTLAAAPSGVILEAADSFVSTAYATSAPAVIYACVLKGTTGPVNIAIAMSTYNATYDWTQCAITVTAA